MTARPGAALARRAVAVSRLSNVVILRPLRSLALFAGRCHCGDGRAVRPERSPEDLISSWPLVEEDWRSGPVTSRPVSALVTAARLRSDLALAASGHQAAAAAAFETAWHRAQGLRVPLALAQMELSDARRPRAAGQPQTPVALLCSVLLWARLTDHRSCPGNGSSGHRHRPGQRVITRPPSSSGPPRRPAPRAAGPFTSRHAYAMQS